MSTDSWVVTIEEDVKTGELLIQLPDELVDRKGWTPGDTIRWSANEDGSWTLTKKDSDV